MRDFIVQFLAVKKEDFLQAKIASEVKKKKKELDADAQQKVRLDNQEEADTKYSLDTWLENIVRKVKPNVTTHPAKFTNAKIDTDTSQIFLGKFQNDGYLKTGNVHLKNKVDVSGNSATNTVVYELYELLDTSVSDTQKFIHKFEEDDKNLIEFIIQLNGEYEDIKSKCLKVYYGEKSQIQTHGAIKQIYFPISENNYHLLSLKTASMLMYEIKNRIDEMNVWIDGVHARSFKKDNKYLEGGFSEIYGITEIGFSHNDFLKMGNYSYLNVKNKGIAYLLASEPPTIEKRSVRLPKTDFFMQCLYRKNFQESFIQLHRLMQLEINNIDIRIAIRNIIKFIIDRVLFEAYKIRENEIYESGWSNQDYYIGLPKIQRIWLDNLYQKEREDNDEWRDELSQDIARWILHSYEKVIQDYFTLGDGELSEVKKFVKEAVKEDKEFF
jgi:CRISPR-associated protein Csy1